MRRPRLHVAWAPHALDDLDDLFEYVKNTSPAAAQRLFVTLVRTARAIPVAPNRGRIVPELEKVGVRTWREVIVPPYRLIYEVGLDLIRVHAIFDGRRSFNDLLFRRFFRLRPKDPPE